MTKKARQSENSSEHSPTVPSTISGKFAAIPPQLEGLIWAGEADIEQLVPLEHNPKKHAGRLMDTLMDEWGFVQRPLVNINNLHIIAGNGREERLLQRKKAGKKAPRGIRVEGERWFMPVDYIDLPEEIGIELALATALNRSQELGDYDHQLLEKAFAVIPDQYVDKLGFDTELVHAMRAYYTPAEEDPDDFDDVVEDAASHVPLQPTRVTLEDTDEDTEWSDPVLPDPNGPSRQDLAVLRYVVNAATVTLFRKAMRRARELTGNAEPDSIIEAIATFYLDANS